MPKRSTSAEPQAAWPAGTDVAAAHKARADAVKARQSSYWVSYKTGGGSAATKEIFFASGMMPAFMEHGVKASDKSRASQRPSNQARKMGFKSVRECPDLQPGGFDGNDSDWASTEAMPDEAREEDVGWLPGPIDRDVPEFNGAKPGPADPLLNADSTPEDIMERLLTDDLCNDVIRYAVSHCKHYRRQKMLVSRQTLKASKDSIEQTWGWRLPAPDASGRLLVRTWIAAKLSVAQLAPEINEEALWDPSDSLYDQKLDEVIPYKVYIWCNRHMSFAEYEPAATAGEEPAAKDRERKRRAIMDKIVEIIGLACAP